MPRLNLPSPHRVVTKSVNVCRRMGYTEDQALHIIMAACAGALSLTEDLGEVGPNWLEAVHEEAQCRHGNLHPR